MDRRLQSRQRVLKFICSFWERHRYPPTMFEITSALRFGSIEAVRYHLKTLREQGAIEWQEGHSRTIRLAGQAWNPPECPNVRAPSDKLVVRLWSVQSRPPSVRKLRDQLAQTLWANRRLRRQLAAVELERDDLGAQLAAAWMGDDDFSDDEWDTDDYATDDYLLRQVSA